MAPLPKATPFKPRSHANALRSVHKKSYSTRKSKSLHESKALANAARYLRLKHHSDVDDTLLVAPGEEDDDEFDSRNAESSEGEDWDDGNTLVTKFMEFDPDATENDLDELNSLVESLKGPFGQAAQALKQDIVDVMVPVMNQIHAAHTKIANGPDRRFQLGILKFAEVIPEYCGALSKEQNAFAQAHLEVQEATLELFRKLKSAYERKHAAKAAFMAALNDKAQSLLESLDLFDEQLDKVEASTEKRLKAMKKLNQKQNNKDLIEYLRLAD